MRTELFDFELPPDRIALRPASPRDSARMLVVQPDDVLLDGEQSLRADETRLIELAVFTVAFVQRDSEGIPVRPARDLAKN